MSRYSKPINRPSIQRPAVASVPMIPIGAYLGKQPKRPAADKGQGEWRTTRMSYRTPETHDVRWSLTASDDRNLH